MKKLKRLLCGILCLAVALGLAACNNNPGNSENNLKLEDVVDFVLEVEAGRDVRILQLTDIQIIDSTQARYEGRLGAWAKQEWVPQNIERLAWKYTRAAVEAVQPDLIVLSGDNVYGEFDDSGVMNQALIAEMESYNIPWTMTFGNHDNETNKGLVWTCEQYINAEHCMFKRGPVEVIDGEEYLTADGNGNFNIGIVQGGKLTEVVWLMDSNGHSYSDHDNNVYSQEGLRDNQIEWFKNKNEQLKKYNGGVSPKSIGFFHHPMRASGDAMQKYGYVSSKHEFYDENGVARAFSIVRIPENDNGDMGTLRVDAWSYIDSEYVFHNLLKKYNCEGWFFGHEHRNDATAVFEGVRYTYGLKASEYDEKDRVGGTEILVGANPLKVTHIYLDGKN